MTTPYDETVYIDQGNDGATPNSKGVWPVGTCLAGGYRVVGVLGGPGQSGMGIVYILERSNGDLIAAKTFQHHIAANFGLLRRFLREARTWLLLGSHPFIVRAIALEIIDAMPVLLMDYVAPGRSGGSLATRIAKGPMPPQEAARLAVQCCDALMHAGAAVPGFVHRDLKPDNLLLDEYDNIKMTDFGLVRCMVDDEWTDEPSEIEVAPGLTHAGSVMGTPAYMAPEQFSDPNHVTARADIYAFGCCFYEALCGEQVFTVEGLSGAQQFMAYRERHLNEDAKTLSERGVECPPELCKTIMKCLAKDPLDRWTRMAELRRVLYEACAGWCSVTEEPMTEALPTADAVAQHVRALALLEGYERAVGHRSLREHFSESPYAFHLALASFFRVEHNYSEEERQLENAMNVRGRHRGYEAVRRLAERYLVEGRVASAHATLTEFLLEHPSGVDTVLEPYVETLARRGEFAEAEAALAPYAARRRGKRLLAEVHELAKDESKRIEVLQSLFNQSLDALTTTASTLESNHIVGVDGEDDIDVLCRVLSILAPDHYCESLQQATPAPWPRMDMDMDIAPDLAYLSWVCGELAACTDGLPKDKCEHFQELANLLNSPRRFENFIHRDEASIWKTVK